MRAITALLFVLIQSSVSMGADTITTFRNSMEFCAGKNMAVLDDMISPANVVAKALFALCRKQNYDLYLQLIAANSSAWRAGYEQAAVDQFTVYVLSHRHTRRVEGKKH